MFLDALAFVILQSTSTGPSIVSQTSLAIMFVVLGVLLMGIGASRISKTKESLLQHRWMLTTVVIITLATVLLVMAPSMFVFYIDPALAFFSGLSLTTLIHVCIGFVGIVSSLIYVFGDLPEKTRKWMRITAALWLVAVALGVLVFLQKLALV